MAVTLAEVCAGDEGGDAGAALHRVAHRRAKHWALRGEAAIGNSPLLEQDWPQLAGHTPSRPFFYDNVSSTFTPTAATAAGLGQNRERGGQASFNLSVWMRLAPPHCTRRGWARSTDPGSIIPGAHPLGTPG